MPLTGRLSVLVHPAPRSSRPGLSPSGIREVNGDRLTAGFADDRLLSVSFLLRSLWPGLVLLLLRLLFLFRQLLLFVFFLVFLATLVSHACSFSAIMTLDGE
jgi:hypothetical protein